MHVLVVVSVGGVVIVLRLLSLLMFLSSLFNLGVAVDVAVIKFSIVDVVLGVVVDSNYGR